MSDAPHLWIPRVKILEPKQEIVFRHRVSGYFILQACNRYGQVTRELVTPNLVTNNGLNLYTTSVYRSTCVVGTGTNTPSTSDTQLQSQVASTASVYSNSASAGGTYYVEQTRVYQFTLGAISANLSEVGVGAGATNLYARDLIRDSGGSPTTFPVTSDEQLRVAHVLRRTIPSGDFNDTISITGSTTHDITVRALNAQTTSSYWGQADSQYILTTGSAAAQNAYETQTLAAVTGTAISGTSATRSSVSNNPYSPGTFSRTGSIVWGLTDANFATGIGSISVSMGSGSSANIWQVAFNPKIAKFAGNVQRILTLNVGWAWDRA